VAYEFRDPLLTTVLDRLPADEAVDIVPMYAADSAFTHEISRATVREWSERAGAQRPHPCTCCRRSTRSCSPISPRASSR
jgi:hypothetical protein